MVRPSAIGSLNGTPISTTSAACADGGELREKSLAPRVTGGEIGDDRGPAALRAANRGGDAVHGAASRLPSSRRSSVCMSLSPRPERQARIVQPG